MLIKIIRVLESLRRRCSTIYWTTLSGNCGKGTLFDSRVKLYKPNQVSFGERCVINTGVLIQACEDATVDIGSDVTLSYRSVLLTGGLNLADIKKNRSHLVRGIVIKDNVWIGANAIILPGVTIYEGSVVAAGSVVSKDVLRNSLVGGVPAKVIRTLNG